VKRLIFLPWNFHKLFLASPDFLHAFGRQEQALQENCLIVQQLRDVVQQQVSALHESTGAVQRQGETLRETKGVVQRLLSEQMLLMTDELWRLRDQHAKSNEVLVGQLREQGRSQQELRDQQAEGYAALAAQLREQNCFQQELRKEQAAWYGPLAEQLREQGRAQQQLADAHESRAQARRQEQLAESQEIRGQFHWVQQLADQFRWVQHLADTEQGLSNWLALLQRKVEMLALDLRERVKSVPENGPLPEPRIVHPQAYHERLARIGDQVRVNLGCGEIVLPDYINVDIREVPDVDVVADIRRLPFEPDTLAEIASAHLVEHFRQHHLATVVLPYWKSLLRPDGILRIVCPNWAAMLRRLQEGKMTLADFRFVTFGAQDYTGDDHFSMYTPESLSEVLQQAGFEQIEVVAEERQNGLCPEMELVARR
jgi:predicted SAM-dependent methyltransferase